MRPPSLTACSVDFDVLPGTSVRHCAECGRSVTDLSAMTEAEARRFMARHPEECVSFIVEAPANGSPEFVRFAAPPRPLLVQLRVPSPLIAAAGLSLAACQTQPRATGEPLASAAPSAAASARADAIADSVPSAVAIASAPPSASASSAPVASASAGPSASASVGAVPKVHASPTKGCPGEKVPHAHHRTVESRGTTRRMAGGLNDPLSF